MELTQPVAQRGPGKKLSCLPGVLDSCPLLSTPQLRHLLVAFLVGDPSALWFGPHPQLAFDSSWKPIFHPLVIPGFLNPAPLNSPPE